MNYLANIIELSFSLLITTPNLVNLLILWLKFFLLGHESLFKLIFNLRFGLNLLSELGLRPAALF